LPKLLKLREARLSCHLLSKNTSHNSKHLHRHFPFLSFICLVVVPIGLTWAVGRQTSNILKTPVSVRAVLFNPFLLRLSVNDFKIMDAQKQTIAGFDRFSVDVSFIRLFRKEVRVESVKLEGLTVNAILLANGKINLMELLALDAAADNRKPGVPAAGKPTAAGSLEQLSAPVEQHTVYVESRPLPRPLPVVIIDNITLQRGVVNFTDQSVRPNFSVSISGIDISITGATTKPQAQVRVSFKAKIGARGEISTEALIEPFAQPLRLEAAFSLNNYALQALTPYAGKYTGHAVQDGKLDVNMTYRIADNNLKASHKLIIQNFGFGEKVDSKDALNLPFGLAIALLEDQQGRIKISLPVSGDISDPNLNIALSYLQ